MKLELTVNGAPGWLEILEPAPECRFRFNGEEGAANVEAPEPGVYAILMDGRCYDAHVEEGPAGLVVTIGGFRFDVAVRDPRRLSRRKGAAGREGAQTLVAPMPGKVVRLLVSQGDAVEAGQTILVVEAMKMQNELKTGQAGNVLSLPVKEGATVAAGEALAIIG